MSLILRRRELISAGIKVERPFVLYDNENNTASQVNSNWTKYTTLMQLSGSTFYTEAGSKGKSYLIYKKPITIVRRDRLAITLSRRQGSGTYNVGITDVFNTSTSVTGEDSIAFWLDADTGVQKTYGQYTLPSSGSGQKTLIFNPFEKNYFFTGDIDTSTNLSSSHNALTLVFQSTDATASIYIKKIELL